MKPVYIYFNNLTFHKENKFEQDFPQHREMTDSVLFSRKNSYYNTSMNCYAKINPDVVQSEKFKLIKKLSDTGQELNTNEPNAFYNTSSINLVANT